MSAPARRRLRLAAATLGLAAAIVLAAHPLAGAATDVWSNVAPAPQSGSNGLFGRYPLGHYALDEHFDFVSASLTGGVDVSGVPPMIAYVFASIVWLLTSFLANLTIVLFSFAFGLDLVDGSQATGGAGALGAVSQAIHSIYANVLGEPWLAAAIAIAGLWAMWRSLVQRRHAETAGALALSLIYVVLAFFFVAEPGASVGAASKLTDRMSESFLAISAHGAPEGEQRAREDAADRLFDLLVFKPWVVLDFGGLEHCALLGTGSGDSDPESAPVRPLSQNPSRDAALARRLAAGSEVSADGKVCVNNASKYAPHFLRFGLGDDGQDERGEEYEALNDGDSSELPDADPNKAGYRLGAADKPASDAMEQGGQFQRLGLALVLFVGELGAMLLLGSLSVGAILAQVLLLLALAFSPVALIAAAIPGRGHAFFKSWLEKLAGFLLRKVAYSLILAIVLAVSGALESATASLGWLMSFGLEALFFWAVFLQRRALAESLVGIATGPGAPGREATVRLLGLYAGARVGGRAMRPLGRAARSTARAPGRFLGGVFGSGGGDGQSVSSAERAPRFGTSYSASVGGGASGIDASGPAERASAKEGSVDAPQDAQPHPRPSASPRPLAEAEAPMQAGGAERPNPAAGSKAERSPNSEASEEKPNGEPRRRPERLRPSAGAPPVPEKAPRESERAGLAEELRTERERPERSESPKASPPAPSEEERPSSPPPTGERKGEEE